MIDLEGRRWSEVDKSMSILLILIGVEKEESEVRRREDEATVSAIVIVS